MGTEKFCLRWNDFENNISQAFRDLRQDEDFFDCTIACEDDQIPAHKVILSACSIFFKDVLKRNPHQHPLVYMKGVKKRELVSLVNFMYHGEVNVAQDELNGFLSVAEDLKVKGLTQSNSSQEKTPVFTETPPQPQPRKSPQISPGYRNPDIPPHKKQKVNKTFSSNHELSSKSGREAAPSVIKKDSLVKSEPVACQDTSLDTSQISDHSDQYGQDYEYAGYDNTAEETDYGTAMAVVDDQAEAQAIQDHANTPSAAADVLMEIGVVDGFKVFSCSVCGKAGKQRRDIRDHIEVNHATSDYYCPYCGYQFRAHVYLRNHVTAKHRDQHKLIRHKMNYN